MTRRVQVHAEADERLGLASDAMADKTALEEERKRTELANHAVHAAQRELRECQIEIEDLKANLTQVSCLSLFSECSSQRLCTHGVQPKPCVCPLCTLSFLQTASRERLLTLTQAARRTP